MCNTAFMQWCNWISSSCLKKEKALHPVWQTPLHTEKNVGCLLSFSYTVVSFRFLFHSVFCHSSVAGVKDADRPGGDDPHLPRLPSPPPPRPTQQWAEPWEGLGVGVGGLSGLHFNPDNHHIIFDFTNYEYTINAFRQSHVKKRRMT